jgi:hypothetical protein
VQRGHGESRRREQLRRDRRAEKEAGRGLPATEERGEAEARQHRRPHVVPVEEEVSEERGHERKRRKRQRQPTRSRAEQM